MILPVNTPTRTWNFKQNKEFVIGFDFFEDVFNIQAIREEAISQKERIRITTIESNDQTRTLRLETELYQLMDH